MPTSEAVKRILLAEGQAGAIIPDRAYCRQGEKVWFAYGKPVTLDESFGGLTVVESIDGMELEERTLPNGSKVKLPKDGVWVLEGPAQKSDERNANNRFYPREIWEKWIQNPNSPAQVAIRERAMLGHLEHPKDGRTDGNEGALVVTEATLEKDGLVRAKFELLDTPKGLILQEYTRKGVKWGVSSRGNGSVNEKGRVNPDDYVLETWDAVMRPSVTIAHPKLREGEVAKHAGSVTEDDKEPVATALSADAERRVQAVETLAEQAIDELDPMERHELSARLLEAVRILRPHMAVPAPTRVQEAVQRAFWKLGAIQEARTQTVDDVIESACRQAGGDEDDGARDYSSVLERVQRQATESATETEELRVRLEDAESRLLRADWRVKELQEQLSSAEATCDTATRRASMAEQLLAERPAREISGHVLDVVDEAVRQVDGLEAFRSLLERCETEDEVVSLAEALLPAVARPAAIEEDVIETPEPVVEAKTESNSRPTLPHGAVVSESDADKPGRKVMETSRGAALAGRAVTLTESKS